METDATATLGRLEDAISALGVDASTLQMIASQGADPDFAAAVPVLSDLADALADSGPAGAEARSTIVTLLQQLRTAEVGGPRGRGMESDALPRELYAELKSEYLSLFAGCAVNPERVALVTWHVRKLIMGQDAYERVGKRLAIPWYFIGIAHDLEASLRFDCHLHNGDPLSARTTHDPPGRPLVWDPPNDWESSAVDAMTVEGFAHQADWSLPRVQYRWEAYNGFGSRRRGIHTPYLWSFSNNYTSGKYVADGVWDTQAVSKQCGAAVLLKALVDGGHVPPPAVS